MLYGTLTLRVMSLGEPDEKGRRRPVETNETVTLCTQPDHRHW